MTIAANRPCRWCLALATGSVRASGDKARKATGEIPHCDAHWDDAYEIVRVYPIREWTTIEQAADTLF